MENTMTTDLNKQVIQTNIDRIEKMTENLEKSLKGLSEVKKMWQERLLNDNDMSS